MLHLQNSPTCLESNFAHFEGVFKGRTGLGFERYVESAALLAATCLCHVEFFSWEVTALAVIALVAGGTSFILGGSRGGEENDYCVGSVLVCFLGRTGFAFSPRWLFRGFSCTTWHLCNPTTTFAGACCALPPLTLVSSQLQMVQATDRG